MNKTLLFALGTILSSSCVAQHLNRSFLDEWKFVGTSAPWVPLHGLAKSDSGVLVGVGDQGVIMRSEAEKSWALQYPDTDARLEAVVYSEGKFIVVASNPGQILTSADGYGWKILPFPDFELKKIAIGDFGYLAAGDNGKHLFSEDGESWREMNSELNSDGQQTVLLCEFVNGVFNLLEFATHSQPEAGSSIQVSRLPTTLKWSEPIVSLSETHTHGTREVTDSDYANGLATLTMGYEGLRTSRDFENWEEPDLPENELSFERYFRGAFHYDGAHYVMHQGGYNNHLTWYLKSLDGENWELLPFRLAYGGNYLTLEDELYVSRVEHFYKVLDLGTNWPVQFQSTYLRFSTIDSDGESVIATLNFSGDELWISSNGVSWNQYEEQHDDWVTSRIEKVNGLWFRHGVYSPCCSSRFPINPSVQVSADGINWEDIEDASYRLLHRDGYYVRVQWLRREPLSTTISGFKLHRSTDLEEWEEISLPSQEFQDGLFTAQFQGERLWITLDNEDGTFQCFWSDDVGTTWEGDPAVPEADCPRHLIADRFIRLEENGFGISEDGFVWESVPLFDPSGSPVRPHAIPQHYENGLYFGIGPNGEIEAYGEEGLLTRHSEGYEGFTFAHGRMVAHGSGNLAVSNIAPWVESTRLVNLSTRGWASTGEETMIAGVVAFESDGDLESDNIIFRGIGPGLEDKGVTDFAANPKIEYIHDSDVLLSNDDWGGDETLADAFASVGAFGLDSSSMDAAILGTPQSNAVSFLNVQDEDGGIALIEAYRVDGANYEFVNLSTRALASESEKSLIGGFVLEGETVRSILIRAIGPSLIDRGVTNPMADPVLTLYQDGKVIASNKGWDGSSLMQHFFDRAHASPLDESSDDAVLVVPLNPGLYTVQASSESGQSGVVLLELFDLGN